MLLNKDLKISLDRNGWLILKNFFKRYINEIFKIYVFMWKVFGYFVIKILKFCFLNIKLLIFCKDW